MTDEGSEGTCFSMLEAENAFLRGDFETALKHFFACIIMLPVERRNRYEDQFAAALHGWISMNEANAPRALSLYPQIRELFPNSIRTKVTLVRAIQSTESTEWHLHCLPICKDALAMATKLEDIVTLRIARVNMTTLPFPQWHIRMINDVARNEAFAKALTQSIKSRSSIVFDIGSGSGLLSVIAAKQTNLVTAIEENTAMAKLSREVLKRNGVEGRVTVKPVHSKYLQTCQKADVIVSETMDCCLFGEHCVDTFIDAHERFSHESTVFIPNKATVYVRLFSCREIFEIHCQDYGGVRYRSDYVKIGEQDAREPYWCTSEMDYEHFEFLSHPEAIYELDFTSLEELKKAVNVEGKVKMDPMRDGVAHGFAIHFIADLNGNGLTLNSSETFAWDLGIIPFKEPCIVKVGEQVTASWKLVDNRLDMYNEFYSEELKSVDECYETATLEQIHKVRDDSYFKYMMAEIKPDDLPHTRDISADPVVQEALTGYEQKEPPKVIIASWCRYDGSIDQDSFFRLEELVGYKDFVQTIVPSRARILGRLFHSERVHLLARPDPSAHCGVDLSPVRSFNLREMRDIRMAERSDISYASDEFLLHDFKFTADGFRTDKYAVISTEVKVQPNAQIADGVIYEVEIMGSRNSKLRPQAAFLFPERVQADKEMTIRFEMALGEILISLKDGTDGI